MSFQKIQKFADSEFYYRILLRLFPWTSYVYNIRPSWWLVLWRTKHCYLQQGVGRCINCGGVKVNTIIWISSGFDSICDGGNVVFNESNPNYFYSLLVENHWMCNTVSGTLSIVTQCCARVFTTYGARTANQKRSNHLYIKLFGDDF